MRFPGIIPAITTPFAADGSIDREGLRSNLAALIEAGVHGLVATGTMGEAGSLTREERTEVVTAAVEAAGGNIPVIAGVSSGSPDVSIGYALDAKRAGADAIMLLPSLGYRGDEREVEQWFRTVAEGAGLPVMAYNNPEASGVDMPADLLIRLYENVEGVVAIKECSGDVRRISRLLAEAPGLEVLVGGDDWALEGFAAGASGWVTGVGVVVPGECVALYEAASAGELERARETYRRMLPLARLDMTPKLVQHFKGAMDAVGQVGGPVRAPRLELGEPDRRELDAALAVLRERPVAA